MNGMPSDVVTRALALGERSRRETLRMLTSAGVGMAGLAAVADAGAKKRKKKKKKCKKPPVDLQIAVLSCPGPKDGVLAGGPRRIAQTFAAKETGVLTAALIEVSGVAAGTDFVVEIRTVDGSGVPTSEILAAADILNVAAILSNPPGTLAALFDPPADVEQGTQYALVLTADVDGFGASVRIGDACPGEAFSDQVASGTFTPVPGGGDFIFSVSITFAA